MSDYWSKKENLEAHAKKRREKYARDPDYRRTELLRQRKLYEEKTGRAWNNPAKDAVKTLRVGTRYAPAQLSVLLNRRADYINRLIAKGLWPAPKDGQTYAYSTALHLLNAFAEHLELVSTYRLDHTDTRAALFAAIEQGGE